MHVMILGGTGCVGRTLIEHLARPGIDVSVVSRSATDLPGTRRVLTGHFGDLIRSTGFRGHLATVDAVVHLADGLSILQQPQHAYDAAEAGRLVQSSERLAQAIRHARVPLFIYVSSIKALAEEEDDRVLVETSEPRSSSLYGLSKRRLESRIASIFHASATRHIILRTPVIYGLGQNGNVQRLLAQVDTTMPLPLRGLRNRRSLLSAHNLASACGAILNSGPSGPNGVFHVHDGPPLSTADIVTTLRRALGRPARLFPVPAWTARLATRLPAIGPDVRRLVGSLQVSDDLFRRTFDWRPLTDTRTALTELVADLAAENGRAEPAPLQMGEAA